MYLAVKFNAMKEDFLHYLWKYQLFDATHLFTSDKKKISVVKTGIYNKNSGPDFLNAHVWIDEQLWVGNVEIHLKSSDWYAHHHEEDKNYDAVILHIVWDYNVEVFAKNGISIPTLELKDLISQKLLDKYSQLSLSSSKWIPCEDQFKEVDVFTKQNWLDRLYVERLEQKHLLILGFLRETNNDWERVLFKLLAKNFGLKNNGEAFLKMANSFPFSLMRKLQSDQLQLSALLFGQSGFLEDSYEVSYHKELKDEYNYLRRKFQLKSMRKEEFQFFRMRPQNFPTIRLAQLSALYCKHSSLFSKLMKVNRVEEVCAIFNVKVGEFWNTHYTFSKESKNSSKRLSKNFIELLIINTIIPLKFSYLKSSDKLKEEELFDLMRTVSTEKNNIISRFSQLNFEAKNALESQALLELKNNYCTKKRCLQCAIGNKILKN